MIVSGQRSLLRFTGCVSLVKKFSFVPEILHVNYYSGEGCYIRYGGSNPKEKLRLLSVMFEMLLLLRKCIVRKKILNQSLLAAVFVSLLTMIE